MDQFLARFPKPLIAIVVMVLALVFLQQMNPPVTICDAQIEIFRDSQKLFLYPKSDSGIQTPARIEQIVKICLNDNSPGGCFELFIGLKKMAVDLRNVPEQCVEAAAQEAPIKTWLWSGLKLMTQLAWGERPPASYMQKNGWLDASDITLYCDLRRHAIRIFGNDVFAQWQEGMLTGMPNASKLTREQVWPRSILSTACESYR